MPAIHQRPAVLLKALLVLITFAIDSGCGSIVSFFLILPFKLCSLKNKEGAGILPLNVPNDFL